MQPDNLLCIPDWSDSNTNQLTRLATYDPVWSWRTSAECDAMAKFGKFVKMAPNVLVQVLLFLSPDFCYSPHSGHVESGANIGAQCG